MPITKLLYRTTKFKAERIMFGKKRFNVYIADSFGKKALGLMHRPSIKPDEGMLFIFRKEGRYDIWMPNMKFSIDIIWLDSGYKILKVVENAEPCESLFSCPPYLSPDNARYVLEFNAGTARREGMKPGEAFVPPHIKSY